MLDKTTVFKDVKDLGTRWMEGGKTAREMVINDLVALKRPRGMLYPALVHRYVVKELGFTKGSDFAAALLNAVAD